MSDELGGSYAEQFGPAFQRKLLACMARVPGFILQYRTALASEYFSNDTHQEIAQALLDLSDEFNVLPTKVTLLEELKGRMNADDLESITGECAKLYKSDVSDAKIVISKAVDFGQTQAMCLAVVKAAEEIESGRKDKVLPLVQQAQTVGFNLADIGIDYNDTSTRADWYGPEDDRNTIPTGIPHLDHAMGGGLGRQELGVVLGPPKRGKTTVLVNIAYGALTAIPPPDFHKPGYDVAYYSCEIRDKKVGGRVDTRLMGKHVLLRKKNPDLYIEKLKERAKRTLRGRLFIKGFPTRTLKPSMIRSHLSLLSTRGFHPDLIVVDYADIMLAERRLGEMRHEQAGIYEDLRGLAGEYDAAMWTASQGNKAALEADTIDMSHFAEAFEKAAIMDAGVALCQTPQEKVKSRARLVLIGMREQADGMVIEADARRDRALIRSTKLLDPSYEPVDLPELDNAALHHPDESEQEEQTKMRKKFAVKSGAKPKPKAAPKARRKKKPSKNVADALGE